MSSDVLVKTENLGKFYPHHLSSRRMLRYLAPWAQKPGDDDFWALRHFDFELKRGEVVGLVGTNGSGKSTMLQMTAGLLEPSEGTLEINGKTAALLELGAGFNPDFTGRENVYLSCRIHGFSIKEIDALFESITHFAAIGDHLDQPVKTYSSGMYARLAFAVAIQVDPDILLVDEILSVGDLGFQARCFKRIEELKESGTSILFVSHDLNSMQMLCDRLILLDQGRKIEEGIPKDVAEAYTQLLSRKVDNIETLIKYRSRSIQKTELSNFNLTDLEGQSIQHPVVGKRYLVSCTITFNAKVHKPIISVQFKTMVGMVVSDMVSSMMNIDLDDVKEGDEIDVSCQWTCHFCPGPYRIGIGIAETMEGLPAPVGGAEPFQVEVISDTPSYGVTHLEPELRIDRRSS